ncbi:MAG: hypothetical protein Q4C95_04160 [Planctomycetia bacterium]|nr:hypothetical protein [Planctomycetia bacterium]
MFSNTKPQAALLVYSFTGIVFLLIGIFGQAQEIDVKSDLWTATDQLGRTLPDHSTVGDVRNDKYIAMFYFLWLGRHGEAGPYNISKIQAQDPNAMNDPNHPLWGKMYAPHHWGESIFNYYVGEDEAVLRKHAQMLADAGVDVICFDVTNQLTYPESYQPLFKVFSEMQKQGNRVPKVAFLCPFWAPTKVVKELWNDVYSKNYYSDVWFYWKGKPLILADPDLLSDSSLSVSTKGAVPVLLTSNQSLAQSFETRCEITKIQFVLPTWTETNSSLTIRLRKESAQGEILDQIEATQIRDNQTFVFPLKKTIPAGTYFIEFFNPQGKVGLYSLAKDSQQLQQNENIIWKEAFENGKIIDQNFVLQIFPAQDSFAEIKDFFTFRAPQPDYFSGPTKANQWGWLEVYPQHQYYNDQNELEELCVGVAQNAVDGKLGVLSHPRSHGRSFHNGSEPAPEDQDMTGRNFQEQWDHALQIDPEIIFVTGWNEWIAGRFDKNAPFNGATAVSFVDQCNQEYSRDIEPMIGGHSDNYYYQLIANIRQFKGVRPPEKVQTGKIIIDGNFSDWINIEPEYRDTIGDPVHRNCRGWGSNTQYINETGRNDFISAKASADEKNVSFYVKTQDSISDPNDPNWMLLLIDSDLQSNSGPMGYDIIVRHEENDKQNELTVYYDFCPQNQASQNDTDLQSNSTELSLFGQYYHCHFIKTPFGLTENQMELTIPRTIFQSKNVFSEKKEKSTSQNSLTFYFKWADNIQMNGDWSDFSINGDVAPNDRFQYIYCLEIQ